MRSTEKRELSHSQNFLRNSKLVARLIDESDIESGDVVYEIGPGKGIITRELAKRCAKVVAIEYDRELFARLSRIFANDGNVEIVFGDFLKMELPHKGSYKVFSNIPFDLTADILAKLVSAPNPLEDSYPIVQEEAAKKYAGSPYSEERFRSLIIKPRFELTILHHFRCTDFYPVPNISIVLLRIKRRANPLVSVQEAKAYGDFVAYAFSQHGRNLKERLKKIFTHEQFRHLARDLHFSPSARPGDLSFDQWLRLFRYFLQGVSSDKQTMICGSLNKLVSQQNGLDKIHRTRNDKKER